CARARRMRSLVISDTTGLKPIFLQKRYAFLESLLLSSITSGYCKLKNFLLLPVRLFNLSKACESVPEPANKSKQISFGPLIKDMSRSIKTTGFGFEKIFVSSGNKFFNS